MALKFATRMPALVPRYADGVYAAIAAERATYARLPPPPQQLDAAQPVTRVGEVLVDAVDADATTAGELCI